MKNLLVYCQDMGGTKAILPLLPNLSSDFEVSTSFVLHKLACRALEESHLLLPHAELLLQKRDERTWRQYLEEKNITHVLTTLSSPYLDETNVQLLVAARGLHIPSLAFLDHWKGFDRFFDSQNRFRYYPDLIGTPDSHVASKLVEIGFEKSSCFAVGHVGLEKLIQKKNDRQQQENRRLLVVSQPLTDKGFVSIFQENLNELEEISEIASSQGYEVFFRPHPKESFSGDLPSKIKLDSFQSSSDALHSYQAFLGVDSMLLLEAFLLGARSFIWKRKEKVFPYDYGMSLSTTKELELGLKSKVYCEEERLYQSWNDLLAGSEERARDLIKNFLSLKGNL